MTRKRTAPAPMRRTEDRDKDSIHFPPVKGRWEGMTTAQTVSLEGSRRERGSLSALKAWGEE